MARLPGWAFGDGELTNEFPATGWFRNVWKQVSPLDRRSLALAVSPRVKKRKGVVTQLAKTGVVVASVAINIASFPSPAWRAPSILMLHILALQCVTYIDSP